MEEATKRHVDDTDKVGIVDALCRADILNRSATPVRKQKCIVDFFKSTSSCQIQ